MSEEKRIMKCPVCGADMAEQNKFWGCTKWKPEDGGCSFKVWKNVAGRELSEDEAAELIEKGQVGPLSGFISKKGTEFSCILKMREDHSGVDFEFPPRA